MDQTTWIIIIAILILIPLMALVVSLFAYVGKVWAIRLLFKNKKGGDQ